MLQSVALTSRSQTPVLTGIVVLLRRLYLYGAAIWGLQSLVFAADALARALLGAGDAPAVLDSSAAPNLIGLVALPQVQQSAIPLAVWLVHWGLAEWFARRPGAAGAAERGSFVRRVYLSLALMGSGLFVILMGMGLLRQALMLHAGELSLEDLALGKYAADRWMLLLTAACWFYHMRVAQADRALVPGSGLAKAARLAYLYLSSLNAFMLTATGGINLALAFVRSDGETSAESLVIKHFSVSALAIWGLMQWVERYWDPAPAETNRPWWSPVVLLRTGFLSFVMFCAVVLTVVPATYALQELVKEVLRTGGQSVDWSSVLLQAASPGITALFAGGVWWSLARKMKTDGELLFARRLHDYHVAYVGMDYGLLGLVVIGSNFLWLLAGTDTREIFAWFISEALIGISLWLVFWRKLQTESRQTEAGNQWMRRDYLVLAVATWGCVAFYGLSQSLVALRIPWQELDATQAIWASMSAVALPAVPVLLALYHVRSLILDIRETRRAAIQHELDEWNRLVAQNGPWTLPRLVRRPHAPPVDPIRRPTGYPPVRVCLDDLGPARDMVWRGAAG